MRLRLVGGGLILCVLLGLPLPLSLADSNPEVTVSINAPAELDQDSHFTSKVNVTEVSDFDACQFDVSYDPSVIEVTDVTTGNIGGTAIPIDMWGVVAQGKIRVIGNVSGVPGVNGSGYLAEIHFHVIGSLDDTSDIDLSNGLLGDKYANPITPVTWVGASVHVSGVPPATETVGASETPVPTATSAPGATPTTETVGASDTPVPTITSAPRSSDTPSPPSPTPTNTHRPTEAVPIQTVGTETKSGSGSLPIAIYALIFVAAIGAFIWLRRQ